MNSNIWRRPKVSEETGLPRSTIYDKMAKGEFPKQFKLGPRAVGWRSTDILAWLASLPLSQSK
jgi:prophage regulatory protein